MPSTLHRQEQPLVEEVNLHLASADQALRLLETVFQVIGVKAT